MYRRRFTSHSMQGAAPVLAFLAGAIGLLAADGRTPVLVELFTSEGCSSCPFADRLLQALEQQQPVKGVEVIVLSEHVDYFDAEGWRDPWGSPLFTLRQRDYTLTLHVDNVFTPQMIVDGKTGFVGNKTDVALKEIAKQAGRPVAVVRIDQLTSDGPSLFASLSIQDVPAEAGKGPFDVMVAVTESGLRSTPDTGENKGMALSHAGVVRSLTRAGRATHAGFQGEIRIKLDRSWKRESVKIVAFVQDRKTRIIWGASRAVLRSWARVATCATPLARSSRLTPCMPSRWQQRDGSRFA
jgi:hypothetical protein